MDDEMREYFYPRGMNRRDWFFEQMLPWLVFAGIAVLIALFWQDILKAMAAFAFWMDNRS